MRGFFSASEASFKTVVPRLPSCGVCGLWKKCQSPKMEPFGEGRRKILAVGEAPGETEDREGRPFIGKAGDVLRSVLGKNGINLDRDCWTTNAAVCRPENNELPVKAVDYCRPNLVNTINRLKPETIILLGQAAVKSLIGWLWKEEVGKMGRWVGWTIPCQRLNAWICPTWHPSYIMRVENQKESEVATILFDKHLQAACKLKGRPWKNVPDYRRQVEVIIDSDQAADAIVTMASDHRKLPQAFDYETDRLKPDRPDSRIVSCSFSNGTTTVSFPWHGRAIKAMGDFLRSDMPKIAANLDMEERWTRKEFGHGVRNWAFDTMQAAHILDNRPGITGLKFQAFVMLGQESYDDHIKPFMKKSKGGNDRNRIKEVDLHKLLVYGGMDSLIEWKLAKIQSRKLGIKL